MAASTVEHFQSEHAIFVRPMLCLLLLEITIEAISKITAHIMQFIMS